MVPARGIALLLLAMAADASESALRVLDPIVFSDHPAVLQSAIAGPWRWRHRVLTRAGWKTLPDGMSATVPTGISGIHVLEVSAPAVGELRWLAIDPPPALDEVALTRSLPRRGAALLAGEPFTVLAMGDSVTNTGWYDRILARLLARATGNQRITVVNRSYPGRSIDASVRHFLADTATRPDLACIMYGLNDQGAWASRDGYIEQHRWLVERLRTDCGADVVLMQPTPDLAPLHPDSQEPLHAALRTLGFAEALRPLAAELNVPLAETFSALWQAQGDDFPDALASLLTAFPLSHDRQFTSVIEGDGHGDTIHPNALGHLALAQAVITALAGTSLDQPLAITATSTWRAEGLVTTVQVRNAAKHSLSGRLEIHPPSSALVRALSDLTYKLEPGAAHTIDVAWPEVRSAEDLFRHPYDRYVAAAAPMVAVLDFRDGACQAHAVTGAITPTGGFVRGRQVCAEPSARVRLATPQGERVIEAVWPIDSAVGRQRLTAELIEGTQRAPVAAELAWVRMASACSGEAVIDGDLGEWRYDTWAPLGEPCQARWVIGPADQRADPGEFGLIWACRAGREAIHLALRITGDPLHDRFTIFCDTRPANQLGSAGPYWWIAGQWQADGTIRLQPGETSPPAALANGSGRTVDGSVTAEYSIPYAALATTLWPISGDLGLSFWWTHQGQGGVTHLQWSEDGHPWSTRWYGVVRRDPVGPLPWVVRVR